MHIKKVMIEGFKSYKNQTETEEFDQGINVVVGANGSGKSNFFHAIRFVLSDVFNTLPSQNRKQLLHEGVGHAVSLASVSVVFDNSDERFPDKAREIVLKRIIGESRDDFYWNNRQITKEGVQNMLESVGFSRSNPYYVVQQGKIMTMTTMTDGQRLELLKEIGGTKVFEDKRRQSMVIMNSNKARQEEMAELVQSFEKQMETMEEELGELEQFTALDKRRRAAQHCIFVKEKRSAQNELQRIEDERQQLMDQNSELQGIENANERVKDMDAQIKVLDHQKSTLQKKNGKAKKAKNKLAQETAVLHTEIQELQERIQGGETLKQKAQEECEQLQKEIQEGSKKLNEINELLTTHDAEEADIRKVLSTSERRQKQLYQKQGRKNQFRNKAERDSFLQKEIQELEQTKAQKAETITRLEQDIEGLNTDMMQISYEMGNMEAEAARADQAAVNSDQEFTELMQQKGQLADDQGAVWQEEEEGEQKLLQLDQQLRECQQEWESVIGHVHAKAINAAKRIVQQHSIEGVHGMLVELIHCPDELRTAVDVAGGSSLYDIVVDDHHVAARIIEYLNKEKSGRVRFIPLADLRPENVEYPTNYDSEDVIPLISKIKFKRQFESAVKQTFGKVLLCRDMDMAVPVAAQTNLNCVTIGGEKADKKGTLTGGCRDLNRNKVIVMQKIQQVEKQSVRIRERSSEMKQQSNKIANDLRQIVLLIQERGHSSKRMRASAEQMRHEVQERRQQERHGQGSLEAKERALAECRESLENINQKISDFRGEMRSELVSQLSAREQQELEDICAQVSNIQQELKAKHVARVDIANQKQTVQTLIHGLTTRREEQQTTVDEWDVQNMQQQLTLKNIEYERYVNTYEQTEKVLQESTEQFEQVLEQLDNIKQEREVLAQECSKAERWLQELSGKLELLEINRSRQQQRVKEVEANFMTLGTIPHNICEELQDKSVTQLRKILTDTNKELQILGPVNQHVLHEYNQFKAQVESLQERKIDLETQNQLITQLIAQLDTSKAQTIELMFRKVVKNFREVFSELVVGGQGDLLMVKQSNRDQNASNQTNDQPAAQKYEGVKVKVQFSAGMDSVSMKQLSGGQKTIVALALIFAIQRCDPAPFYLFDEVDAALDPQYRTTVANLLLKQSVDVDSPAQYIVTTFHPQIVEVSHKVYGVSHNNRISTVQVITREEALQFLTEDISHQTSESQPAGPSNGQANGQHHPPQEQQNGQDQHEEQEDDQ